MSRFFSKNFFQLLKQNNFGFTLIEFMTVVVIIIAMSSLIAVNYRHGSAQVILDNQAMQFAQDLRLAREMALSLRSEDGVAVYGYGIIVPDASGNSYKLYADQSADGSHKWESESVNDVIKTVAISNQVDFKCYLNDLPSPCTKFGINYIAPHPITNIFRHNTTYRDNMKIVFKSIKYPAMTRTVVANAAGLVYVE